MNFLMVTNVERGRRFIANLRIHFNVILIKIYDIKSYYFVY